MVGVVVWTWRSLEHLGLERTETLSRKALEEPPWASMGLLR